MKDNIFVFDGANNPFVMSRVYDVDWICDYDMRWYPFDTQVRFGAILISLYLLTFQSCAMIFDSDGNSGEFVELVAEELNYLGPKDLTQYFIRQTNMNKTIKGSIRVEVVLGRRLLGTVLTVYIPTILLIFIAHTTNYFKSFFFEAVVSVNLTVMLVN